MEKCYEYFGCTKLNCVCFTDTQSKKCWEIPNTLCNHEPMVEIVLEKRGLSKCTVCLYYKSYNTN